MWRQTSLIILLLIIQQYSYAWDYKIYSNAHSYPEELPVKRKQKRDGKKELGTRNVLIGEQRVKESMKEVSLKRGLKGRWLEFGPSPGGSVHYPCGVI